MVRQTRRDVLHLGVAGLALLAGCQGGDGQQTTTTTRTTEPTTASATTPGTTTDPAAQRETALRLVRLLADGDYETAHGLLSPQVRDQLSASDLETTWQGQTAERGRFVGVGRVDRTTSQGYDVLVVRAQFEGGVLAVQVSFDGDSVVGLFFAPTGASYSPPEYADRDAFEEETLTLDSACGLGATLTRPTEDTRAGVVLVHGSGPHDRDETIGPNKPFKDLAWGLASQSVAVLRYEKRTYACDVTADDLSFDSLVAEDALAALTRLRAETGVTAGAVVGHSLGGYAAPRIAARDGDAAAYLLAAPSRPIYELVPEQVRYLAELDGSVTAAEREQLDAARATADRLAAENYEDGGFSWSAAFWEAVAEYDPVATATSLDAPVYALQGGRDYQVSPERDFPAWRDALPEGRTRLYDPLNHLFVPGEGQPNPGEYFRPGNVAESVVTDLTDWLTG